MTLTQGISRYTLLVYLTLSITTTTVLAFQKAQCNQIVTDLLNNGSLSTDDSIFYRSNGLPMSNLDNLILTVPGCVDTCGAGSSFYVDIGPRLSTWLIPILLLIGNAHFARLGREKYLMILHILGDPIDSMWSLLTKAELWSRCYSLARTYMHQHAHEDPEHYERRILDVATVYAAIEDLLGSGTDQFRLHFEQILREKRPDMTTEHFYHLTKEVANELSDSRSNELRRAGLAVLSYLYHVIAAFVEAVGGKSSSPPGGRIGTALLLSFLIPLVLVSNAMGGYTSRRTCLRIMERYVKTVTGNSVEDLRRFSAAKPSRHFFAAGRETSSTTDFYSAQLWTGTVTCYTPRKSLGFVGGKRDNSPALLLLAALLPVFVATVISITEICLTPTTGLGCRSVMLLVIFLLWVTSAFITWVTWRTGLATGRYHYMLTTAKDAVVAVPIVVLIFLSSCGLFNSCYCWSAVFSRRGDAHVILDDSDERRYNAETYYPGLVTSCLGAQFLIVLWMLRLIRHGSTLFRRDEQQKQQDWLATHAHRRHLTFSPGASPEALMPRTPGYSPEVLLGKSKPLGSPELAALELDSRISSSEPLLRMGMVHH
ncbi:hypothetical protein FE257_008919 [Aspergillus nanangensis]|uniref:Uncharacterized protein n=1 Tax=Aspergillus nanangensis TaxID=2582783 RepID=A0AAD4CWW3_ASPNN|nr:hypothetical protein FE257_008919 [Aspergillus nanangensis]